jgi:stage V sporulation protein SpoVS
MLIRRLDKAIAAVAMRPQGKARVCDRGAIGAVAIDQGVKLALVKKE